MHVIQTHSKGKILNNVMMHIKDVSQIHVEIPSNKLQVRTADSREVCYVRKVV